MLRSTLRLPSGGTSSRAATTGTVAANRHRLKVDPALWDDTQGHHDCSRAERLRVIRAAFRESGIGESMDEVELRRALGAVGYNPTEDQLVDIMLKVSKPFLLQRMDHELPVRFDRVRKRCMIPRCQREKSLVQFSYVRVCTWVCLPPT